MKSLFGRFSLVVLAMFIASLMFTLPAAAATTYTVVTPNNPDGWQPANVRADATVGITTAQPRGTAPNNLGSLEFTTNTVTSGQDKADYVKYWGVVPGRTLGNISALSYDFFRASSSTTAQHFVPAFRLVYATSGGQTGYLIWENVYNGGSTATPVPTDQWISNDIIGGYFWMRAFSPGRTIEKYDVTLAQWASGYTYGTSQPLDANTNIIGIEVGVGSSWGGTFTGYVDQVAASFGSDSVTANFEANPVVVQCTTDCYVDDDTGNDANGGTSFADAKQHIQAGINQVSSGGTVHVKDGTYNENLVINKPLTLEGNQHGVLAKGRSGAQSVVQALNTSVPVNIQADSVKIDGFVFDGTAAKNQPWIITALSGPGNGRYNNVQILNNEFKGNPVPSNDPTGAYPGGMYLSNHDDPRIEGNYFNALGQHAVFLAGSSTNAVYRNNDSYRNYNSNISTQDQGPGHTNIVIDNNRAVEDDMILFNMHNAKVRGNEITGGSFGPSRIVLGGGNTNVTIDSNSFSSLYSTAIQILDYGFGYGANSNITITSNDIFTSVANQVDNYSLIDLRDVNGTNLVDGNRVALSSSYAAGGSATYAVGVRGSGTGKITITNNEFDGGKVSSTGTPPSSGVLIRSNSGNGAIPSSAIINVANNYLKNFSNGLTVYDFIAGSYGGLANGVTLTANKNSITGNSANGVITGANDPTLDAENNWWGSASGPQPTGTGDRATGNVDYDPWLCSGTDDDIAVGFQTSSSSSPCEPPPPPQCTTTCYVDDVNGSDTNGGASVANAKKTIQAAVNQVSPNGKVIVAAGTYNENVTVNKDGLSIQGAGKSNTIIQGTNCTGNGITLVGSRNGLTIEDLSVTGFENGIYLGVISDTQTNITIEDVNASNNCRHGIISQDGVITNLMVNRVTASNNGFPNSNVTGSPGRGIWIINGIKTNISITNSTVSNNFISGIDFGDGNVTGLTVTGNTVDGNGDAGISVLGAKGPGANLIDNNTVRDNGRFGIEVKASTGTGSDSGAGSLVVSSNIVQRAKGTDPRDYAGIAVIRRSGQAQFNDDQPSGAVVKDNEVSGFHRKASGSTGDGFGIVIEGLNNVVKNNKVTDNDVGIQVQGGNTANTQSTAFFDRGDAVQGSAVVNLNSITGNGIGLRTVGTITPTPLNAERNWWGSSTGPQPTGSGDSVVSSTPNGVDYDPWLCSGIDDQPNTTGFQTSSSSSPCTGTIAVTKYNDLNRNGARDNGEPGLSGWTITVSQGNTQVASGTTDNNGSVSFPSFAPGNYTVCETQQSGWTNTDPSNGSGCKTATVTLNGTTNVLLGNAQQQGGLTITKYNDLNRNGARDTNEPGLSGWTITVKQGTTTVATKTTDSNGSASFTGLMPGSYTVCETLQSGWQNTDPSNGSGCKTATVTANGTATVLLGNASTAGTGTLKVTKYNDINRSGTRDAGEPGLAGWIITVKQGTTTVASGTTNANGEVTFTLLPASVNVCETQQSGWQNTDPSNGSGCKTASVKKGSITSVVLGNASAPTNPAPAQPGKIYAVNDGGLADSQFFTVNLSSPNTVTALGPLYKDYDIEGLDIDPRTGVIYATSGGDNKFNQKAWLYKVDGVTGALTPIGGTGQKEVESLAFAPDGKLWGWGIGKGLITINTATGASTLILKDSKDVEGLAFSNDGTKVYASVGKKLYVYTVATNKIAELASNLPGMTEALETRPDGKLLLGVDGSKVIYVYDPTTTTVTAEKINVAPYSDVEGIGYSAFPPVAN